MKTIELLNKLLAELTLAERNIHILHWNVMGKQFKMIHEYFQEIYENIQKENYSALLQTFSLTSVYMF